MASQQMDLIKTISHHNAEIKRLVNDLLAARDKSANVHPAQKQAEAFGKNVKPLLDEIRDHVDAMEMLVDDEMWPLPKYREMMFLR